jgi:hypothetical protein
MTVTQSVDLGAPKRLDTGMGEFILSEVTLRRTQRGNWENVATALFLVLPQGASWSFPETSCPMC